VGYGETGRIGERKKRRGRKVGGILL
jgi:hypothetical protein